MSEHSMKDDRCVAAAVTLENLEGGQFFEIPGMKQYKGVWLVLVDQVWDANAEEEEEEDARAVVGVAPVNLGKVRWLVVDTPVKRIRRTELHVIE